MRTLPERSDGRNAYICRNEGGYRVLGWFTVERIEEHELDEVQGTSFDQLQPQLAMVNEQSVVDDQRGPADLGQMSAS